MQTCSKCEAEKAATDFYAGKKTCKDCVKHSALARYHSNKDAWIKRTREWQASNPDKHRAYCGKRDAIRRGGRKSIPRNFEISSTFPFYAEAILREAETGVPHHVDHITPVTKGGLHHASNLQVLTASENILKGDKT